MTLHLIYHPLQTKISDFAGQGLLQVSLYLWGIDLVLPWALKVVSGFLLNRAA